MFGVIKQLCCAFMYVLSSEFSEGIVKNSDFVLIPGAAELKLHPVITYLLMGQWQKQGRM